MTTTTNPAVIDQLHTAFNAGDIDAIAACYAVDAEQQHPFFQSGNHGREAIRTAEGGMFSAFSDIEWTFGRVIEADGWVAVEAVVQATNTGDIPMPTGAVVPATGRQVRIPMSEWFRVDDAGLIAEEHRYFDVAGFLGQLGLMG